jgi:hypothetical protein
MPLIDLQTDLKSLRYGKDRPGGGSSNQPYHKVDYRRKFDQSIDKLAQTGGSDLILRGGYLTLGIPGYASSRILADEERIGKWLTSAEGLVWIGQQNVLSQLGTRIYGGYPQQIQTLNAKRLNDGAYTPFSTLAAVAGNAFGGHPNKQGIDFTGTVGLLARPQYINLINGSDTGFLSFGSNPQEEGILNPNKNRLVNLYRTKIANEAGSNSTELYSYKGGPQSGEGLQLKTVINTASYRTQFRGTNAEFLGGLYTPLNYSTFSQQQIEDLTYNSSNRFFIVGSGNNTNVQDFRKLILDPTRNGSNLSTSPDYKTKNYETRVHRKGGGNPGKRGVDRSNYTNGRPDLPLGVDTINSFYLYKSAGVTTDERKNDLVKFRIAVIDNDNPNLKVFAHFRSFINSFSDNTSADWDSFKYLGRGENFYNYRGFTRTCSMSFTLMAQSIQELSIMYQKLNYLISSLTPDYNSQGYMRGSIVQLTLGGYFYEMPGIINSINVEIPNDTTWEIGIPATPEQSTEAAGGNGFTDSQVKELPHRLEVSMEFTPLYKFLPEKVKDIYGGQNITQRFLSLEDAGGNKNTLYSGPGGQGVPGIFTPPRASTADIPAKEARAVFTGLPNQTIRPQPQLPPINSNELIDRTSFL